MITTEKIHAAETNDAELVAESLAGGREAFRQIVERHQTLVCSLAYCATGSLTQSEDLAQETFLAAWRRLSELREPAKLRPWLCGIARFVICNELRRQGRQPVHAAETLEAANELAAPEPLPSERVISREEEAILWHCVAGIPEIYREPLVLFYREHQSIARVAEALELTEDAVKQRLARGRKLLQEQALAYVEGALRNTNPGPAFAVGVITALSLSATSAKAVTAGAMVKGGSTIKTVAGLAAVGALILYWSLLGFLAFAGACAGYWMSRASASSARQCENGIRFWRTLAWGFAISFILGQLAFSSFVLHGSAFDPGWWVWKLCLDSFYVVVVVALAIWIRGWWREFSLPEIETRVISRSLKRRLALWLFLGVVGTACSFGPILEGVLWQTFVRVDVRHLSNAEFQKIVSERKDAYFGADDDNGTKTFEVGLPENNAYSIAWRTAHMPGWWNRWTAGAQPAWWNFWMAGTVPRWWIDMVVWTGWRPVRLLAADSGFAARLLNEKGIHYATGFRMNISREALPFGSLLPFFIVPMAGVILLRQMRKGRWPKTAPRSSETLEPGNEFDGMLPALRADPGARRVFGLAFAAAFLVVFTATAFTVTQAFTTMGLYVVLVLGSLKGAFFGLVAGVGVLYLRTRRTVSRAGAKK